MIGTIETPKKSSANWQQPLGSDLSMATELSQNEREALSHFLAKVISDVDKVAQLFESRGADATLTRAAQANLEATLADLRIDSKRPNHLPDYVPENF